VAGGERGGGEGGVPAVAVHGSDRCCLRHMRLGVAEEDYSHGNKDHSASCPLRTRTDEMVSGSATGRLPGGYW
jgi:hypothetical protein